jgi:hypothetical protein
MNPRKVIPSAILSAIFAASIVSVAPAPADDEQQANPLEEWKYPGAKSWGATIRKHLHSANAHTDDALDKVLEFYKEKSEQLKKTLRDPSTTEASFGTTNFTSAAGEPTMTTGWVLLRVPDQTITVHLWRSSAEKVTHMAVVLDER